MTTLLVSLLLCADPATSQAKTAHYDISAERLDAAEIGRMLEQHYVYLERFFGRAPTSRMRVEVHADLDRYKAALGRDGHSYPGGGGYFAPNTRKAYLFIQPSDYFTRHLILHEATHQFQALLRTDPVLPRVPWYIEGLAEYFGMHNWDGRRLEVGIVPAITLEDYPAKALKQWEACGGNLEGLIAGRVKDDRALSWAWSIT